MNNAETLLAIVIFALLIIFAMQALNNKSIKKLAKAFQLH